MLKECVREADLLFVDHKLGWQQVMFGRDFNERLEGVERLFYRQFLGIPNTFANCLTAVGMEMPHLANLVVALQSTDFFWDNINQWSVAHQQIKQAQAEKAYALAGYVLGKTLVQTTGGAVYPEIKTGGILPYIIPDILPVIVIPEKEKDAAEIAAGIMYGIT